MDRVEQMLAEEFRSAAGAPTPDSALMLTRVRRHLRRRAVTGAAAAVTAVLTAGGAVAAVSHGQQHSSPVRPGPGINRTLPEKSLVGGHFTKPDQGYLLWLDCPPHPRPELRTCRYRLTATADGGRTWQPLNPPPTGEFAPSDIGGDTPVLVPLPTGGLLVADAVPDTYWFSDNLGVSWRKRSAQPQGSVLEVPDGGMLREPKYSDSPLIVIRPDGSAAWLQSPARPSGDLPFVIRGADGSFWLNDPPRVSRDRGRTWRDLALPVEGPAELTTVDGRRVYALVSLSDNTGHRLFESADSGRSWTPVPLPVGEARSVLAAPDGGLLLQLAWTGGRPARQPGTALYRRAPHGGGFTFVTDGPLAGVQPAGARLVRIGGRPGHSRDGTDWSALEPPD